MSPSSKKMSAAVLLLAGTLVLWTATRDADPVSRLTSAVDSSEVDSVYQAILTCFEEDGGSAQASPCKDRVSRNEIARTNPATVEAALDLGLGRRPELFGPACHAFSHLAGQHMSAEIVDLDALAAVAGRSTDVCQFGMYHGLVEGYADSLDFERLRAELPRLCTVLREAGTFGRASLEYAEGECNHVLGHVAARATRDEVPAGLRLCDTLTYASARTACGTGVIMNWTDTLYRLGISGQPATSPVYLPVPAERRWEVCLHVPEEYQPPCALWMGSATVSSPDPDHIRNALAGYTTWCAQNFQQDSVVEACWMSVGMMGGDLATMTHLGGWEGVLPLCSGDGAASHLDACLSQMTGVAASFLSEEQMLAVCALPDAPDGVCEKARESLRNSFVDTE